MLLDNKSYLIWVRCLCPWILLLFCVMWEGIPINADLFSALRPGLLSFAVDLFESISKVVCVVAVCLVVARKRCSHRLESGPITCKTYNATNARDVKATNTIVLQ